MNYSKWINCAKESVMPNVTLPNPLIRICSTDLTLIPAAGGVYDFQNFEEV
jgi:hypothetical protein